jgi:3-keto-5-aminohexanoate cleavage enzyme
MHKMIVEARINEYAMRHENPHVPWTVDEIVESAARCREAGAAILHYHARGDDGSPQHTVEKNAEIIRAVRKACDMVILPTLGFFSNDTDPATRINCILELAKHEETRPDIVPIDTGSTNLDLYDRGKQSFSLADRVYLNRTGAVEYYLRALKGTKVKPKMTCWNIGYMRRAIAFMDMGLIAEPGYFLVNMTDGPYLTGHPGTLEGLDSFLPFLPKHYRHYWAANIVGGSLVDIAEGVARRGGGIAPGIGDHPYTELGSPANHVVVRTVCDIARRCGREIASPAEVREMLDLPR